MPTPVMTTGTSMGSSSSPITRLVVLDLYLASPAAARVPKQVAITIAHVEINKLFRPALIHLSLEKTLLYQVREKLVGGKEKYLSGLKDKGIITTSGNSKNSRIRAQSTRNTQIQKSLLVCFMAGLKHVHILLIPIQDNGLSHEQISPLANW